jgi:hypothetical protein
MTNLVSEDMAELRRQGIAVDDDNDPAPENIPDRGAAPAAAADNLNWKGEGIICPRKSTNRQNSFAGFTHYSRDDVLCMSKLDLFMTPFPVNYLNDILITNTNKESNMPMDLQEFIQWIGCWLYMAC